MIRFAYIFLLTGGSCLLELLLRNFGLLFPVCAFFVFYTATAFGTAWGLTAAGLGALCLDFSGSDASHPWSLLILAGVTALARLWLRRSESDSILPNFLPGFIIPFLVWLPSAFFFADHIASVLSEQFPAVFPAAVLGAVWLPVEIFLLDILNDKLALPLFTDAKLKQKLRL